MFTEDPKITFGESDSPEPGLVGCIWPACTPLTVNVSALLSVVPRKPEPIPALPPVLQVPDLSATMLVSMARVPLLVIVPPVRPVPATTLVTVPVPAGWQLTVPS